MTRRTWRLGVLVFGAWMWTAGASRPAVAGPSAVIAGRITFRDNAREARAGEVERMRWGHITVEMRRGWEVFSARPDAEGLFTIVGPPGTYSLEYIRLGELAEFIAPHQVVARAGVLTCMGTLELHVLDLNRDLGNNMTSELRVRNECASMEPELRHLDGGADAEIKTTLARPVPPRTKWPGAMDVLVGFRGDLGFDSAGVTSLRGSFVLPLRGDEDRGYWLVGAAVMHVGSDFVDKMWPSPAGVGQPSTSVWGGVASTGYRYSILEAQALGGFLGNPGRGAHGPLAGLSLRFGNITWGIGGRAELYPSAGDRVLSLTLDLSPVALLGSLL
jgi:hypothetical protein